MDNKKIKGDFHVSMANRLYSYYITLLRMVNHLLVTVLSRIMFELSIYV